MDKEMTKRHNYNIKPWLAAALLCLTACHTDDTATHWQQQTLEVRPIVSDITRATLSGGIYVATTEDPTPVNYRMDGTPNGSGLKWKSQTTQVWAMSNTTGVCDIAEHASEQTLFYATTTKVGCAFPSQPALTLYCQLAKITVVTDRLTAPVIGVGGTLYQSGTFTPGDVGASAGTWEPGSAGRAITMQHSTTVDGSYYYVAYVIPQDFEAGTVFFQLGDNTYTLSADVSFQANRAYTCTLYWHLPTLNVTISEDAYSTATAQNAVWHDPSTD